MDSQILCKIIREDVFNKPIFEQRPESNEEVSHVDIGEEHPRKRI